MKKIIGNILFFAVPAILFTACSGVKRDITEKELRDHIAYLASDSLKGRETGTEGDSIAAEYIRRQFTEYGLIPLEGDGFQRFKVISSVTAGPSCSLTIGERSFTSGDEFIPFTFSANSELSAEVVFAGYGFNIDNDSTKWNDYEGLNVSGKWVLILRGDPEPDNAMSSFAPFSGDREKTLLAKDMGAGGVLLVSGEVFDKEDIFDPMAKSDFSSGIPALRIKRSVADAIISGRKTSVNQLEKEINSTLKSRSFNTGINLSGKSEVIQNKVNTRNVVMLLPGEDPAMKEEYMVFGAHFDHLGMGGKGSSSRSGDTIAVHYGADDNASGVSMIVELAGRFAGTKGSHKRSIIFVAFSGEESGLLGSKYFTENSPDQIKRTRAMVNFDMVGRLEEDKNLQVGGVGTAEGLKEIAVRMADTNKLKLSFTEEGSGPSDHSAFYAKDIPVLYFTTGAHTDYHTPFDTWDKIDYEGMVTISDLVFSISSFIVNDTSPLAFKEAGPKGDVSRGMRRRGITLGIMPDFSGSSTNGLRVDLVTAGKPAAIGGMKKGDIIVAIDNKPVNNIQDYMFRLGQLKRGATISVEVMRNGKKEVLIIQL